MALAYTNFRPTETEAKQTTVFTYDENGAYSVNLHDFIMESADKTTTPHGIDYICYIRENENGWDLRKWVAHGSQSFLVGTVETEMDAKEWLWDKHCIAFDEDDQRNTSHYSTLEEAQDAYKESYSIQE